MINLYEKFSVKLEEKEYFKLCLFKDLLKEYNEKVNLTGITEDRDIHIKHFIDSLKGEKYFPKNSLCAEVGSGGGFPSVPLMIFREDLKFLLIESVGKKCVFLEEAIKKLSLNGEVINKRAEDLAVNSAYREKYDCVTARAVAKMNTLSEYCLPLTKRGGRFIAYKNYSEEEFSKAENALKILGGKYLTFDRYFLAEEEPERAIAVVEKISSTPLKYPRRQGKERSKPL